MSALAKMEPDSIVSDAAPAQRPRGAITPAFIAEVLQPYRANAKYLHAAELTYVRGDAAANDEANLVVGRGHFTIPESCYIDDTGHFNAVEFNICYNQLAYVVFGHCIAAGVLRGLVPGWDDHLGLSYADFKRHQLPSMLIAKLEGRFLKQLNSGSFIGELTVNRITTSRRGSFCFTSIAFSDGEGVKSRGSVVLAFAPAQGDAHANGA